MRVTATIFEVMDKEPTLVFIWGFSLCLAIVGYVACRHYKWSPLFLLPLALFFAFSHLLEIHDPQIAPHVLREAGRGYVIQSYIAQCIMVLAPCAGALVRVWKERELKFA